METCAREDADADPVKRSPSHGNPQIGVEQQDHLRERHGTEPCPKERATTAGYSAQIVSVVRVLPEGAQIRTETVVGWTRVDCRRSIALFES
jgi:hypothetical protein